MENSAQQTQERTIGELIASISEQVSALVRGEINYAITNAKAKGKTLGLGGVFLGIATVLAFFAFLMGLIGGAIALALVVPEWAAYLIVAGILLFFALIFALIGGAKLKKSKEYTVDPKAVIDRNVDAVKKGLDK